MPHLAWDGIHAALVAPLQTEQGVAQALEGIRAQCCAGQTPPASIVEAISSVLVTLDHGCYLYELCSDVQKLIKGVASVAASGQAALGKTRRALGHNKRRRVDALSHGPKVERWEELLELDCGDTLTHGPDAQRWEDGVHTCQAHVATEPLELDCAQVGNNPQTNAKGPEMGSACRRRHRGRAAWRPGWNTHGYIGRGSRGHRVGEQAQVLIVNGYKRLRALSKPEQRTLRDIFPPCGHAANQRSGHCGTCFPPCAAHAHPPLLGRS